MGIFKSIGNFIKKVAHGVRDVFRSVRKGFSKLMGNKFFRGALLAVSLFTGGVALIGAFQTGGLSAVGNLIVGKAASIITSPLKFISQGITGVGNKLGLDSLATFGTNLTKSLGNFQDAASSIFGVAGETGGEIAKLAAEGSDLTDLSETTQESAMDLIDVDADSTGLLDQAKELGPGDYEASGPRPPGIPEPGSLEGESLYPGTSDLDVSQIDKLEVAAMEAPIPEGLDVGSTIQTAAETIEEPGGFMSFAKKTGGLLKRGLEVAEDNSVVTSALLKGFSTALSEPPESAGKSLREEFLFRNNMWEENAPKSGLNIKSSKGVKDLNRGIRERGQKSRERIRGRADSARKPQLTIGDAAGFGAEPMVYKPIFGGGG